MTAVEGLIAPPARRPPRRWRMARQSRTVLRRHLLQLKGDPLQALDVVMPMALGAIFVFVFGGAVGAGAGTDYTQYLLPGIMIQAISIVSVTTGIGLSLDFDSGVMDRYRALPIARAAILAGRIAADVCRMALALLLVFGFSLAIGFRVRGGVTAAVGALLLILAFGVALSWVSAFIGLAIRSPQTVQSIGYAWLVPLQFASSLFVPADTLPPWLHAVVAVNPMTLICDAVRGLLLGAPAAGAITGALVCTAAVIAVFATAAIRQFARRI